MISLIINFILLLFVANRYTVPFSVCRIILYLYTASALTSILGIILYQDEAYSLNLIGVWYFILCQWILFFPLLKLRKLQNVDNYKLDYYNGYIRTLSYILIILGIGYIILSIPKIIFAMAFGNQLEDLRQAYYNNTLEVNTRFSLFDLFCNISIHTSYIVPFLSLYFFTKRNYKLSLLLLIPSFTLPISGYVIGEREAFVKWLFMFLLAFCFFYRKMGKKQIKIIKKTALIICTPLILFIIAMTFARFGDRQGGVLRSLFGYFGEQPYNFSLYFDNVDKTLDGKQNFDFFTSGPELEGLISDRINSPYFLNVFAGIPGSFWLDFGLFTIIFCMFFSFIIYLILKSQKKPNLLTLIYYVTFLYIIFMGVFYYDFTLKYYYWWLIFYSLSIPFYKFMKNSRKIQIKEITK